MKIHDVIDKIEDIFLEENVDAIQVLGICEYLKDAAFKIINSKDSEDCSK